MENKIYSIKNHKIDDKELKLQETIFHTANGRIGVRGCIEEGMPDGYDTMRGTYISGVYDMTPMKQAELLCNMVEDKETIVNVADTQTMILRADDRRVSIFEPGVSDIERILDMKKGITIRRYRWDSGNDGKIDVEIKRMTSFDEKRLFLIDYCVRSVDYSGDLSLESLHSGLAENYVNPDDPRMATESVKHIKKVNGIIENKKSFLLSSTVNTDIFVASAVGHEVYVQSANDDGNSVPEGFKEKCIYNPDMHEAVWKCSMHIDKGNEIHVIKYSVFADSIRDENPTQIVKDVLSEVQRNKADYYYSTQKKYLDGFWKRAKLDISGDRDLSISVNFNMYALLESACTDGHASISAKGLSGEGYEGHYFWDTEMFMLPFFSLTSPDIAKMILSYRYRTLGKARENARRLGHKKGALYPWRTITGRECSGYFVSGDAAYHIDGDIAYAVISYYLLTGDWDFIKKEGLEIITETARLWMDVGNYNYYDGTYRINCVTGPDEYTCMINNNYYTNSCAKYNLEWACKLLKKLQKEPKEWKSFADRLKIDKDEILQMQKASDSMYLPYDKNSKINPQDDSFLSKPVWDLENEDKKNFPLLLHYHPLHLYRYQVCKQADTVMSHFLFPQYQDKDTMLNSFSYYEKITTHDSSLSTCVFSMTSSMLGMYQKAYDYLGDSAKLDLLNTHKNSADGIHAANMGGCYMAIVYGFGGFRVYEDHIELAPYLPQKWNEYCFRLTYLDSVIQVSVSKGMCTITHIKGKHAVALELYGDRYDLKPKAEIKADLREN